MTASVLPQEVVWMNPEESAVPTVAVIRRSEDGPWHRTFSQLAHCLRAGSRFVVVPDEQTRTACVYSDEFGLQRFGPEGGLELPGFAVRVADFFA